MQAALKLYQRGIECWGLGRQEEALSLFEQALALDEQIAGLPYQEGLAFARAGQFNEAEAWLWLARLFRPGHAPALSCLGDVLRRVGRAEQGLELHREAVALAPESWEAHSDLALTLCDLDRFGEAYAALERAIELHGLDVNLATNLASVLRWEGRAEEALRTLDEVLRIAPDLAAAHVNRAHLLLLRGRYPEGWREYEWRPQRKLPEERRLRGRAWVGKRVLLHQEQGGGDLIHFVRYAARLDGAHVTVACDDRYIPLVRRARGVADAVSWNGPFPSVELEENLLSLPGIFGEDIPVPYMDAEPGLVRALGQRLGGETRRRVGLVWGGNPANPLERRRAIPLARVFAKIRDSGVAFYSLQLGPQRRELEGVRGIIDLAGECATLPETAAAMMNLDLIISADTMTAHLAGALGRPVWVLLPFMPDWRWLLDRDDSPWYPTMRLFRQARVGDWEPVFEQVAAALRG